MKVETDAVLVVFWKCAEMVLRWRRPESAGDEDVSQMCYYIRVTLHLIQQTETGLDLSKNFRGLRMPLPSPGFRAFFWNVSQVFFTQER